MRLIKKFGEEIVLGLLLWVVYLAFQSKSIFGGDAGDLVTASYVWGVPHSPGYPLYTFLGGVLIRLVPLFTVSWRVALISSFFAAFTVTLFYTICKRYLDVSKTVALIGSLTLAFLYPFWLYAEVVEVFSLASFLMLSLFVISLSIRTKPTLNKISIFGLIFGLSITHHHTFVFVLPAVLVIMWPKIKEIFKILAIRPNFFRAFIFLILGLSPLLYLPIASLTYPPVDWEHPATFYGFARLFFRSAYGTFRAGAFSVDDPVARIYSVLSFFKFFLIDLKALGLGLFLIGIFESFRKGILFWPLSIGLLSYLFFLFYASFPLVNDFSLATYERFTIFSYIFAIFFVTIGIKTVLDILNSFIKVRLFGILAPFIFLIIPIGLFIRNFPSIYALRDDFTAENVARDTLRSVPPGSLLILINDTSIFNTQYVYYTEGYDKKFKLIPLHLSKLYKAYYHENLKRQIPSIYIPNIQNQKSNIFLDEFIEKNSNKFSVVMNFPLLHKNDLMVPRGLVYQYFPKGSSHPTLDKIVELNEGLWKTFQDLNRDDSIYRNLFLREVLNIYSTAHQNYAYFLLDNNKEDIAQEHLIKANILTPSDQDVYFLMGLSHAMKKECEAAEKQFLRVLWVSEAKIFVYDQLIKLGENCFMDPEKKRKYEELKMKEAESNSPQLQGL